MWIFSFSTIGLVILIYCHERVNALSCKPAGSYPFEKPVCCSMGSSNASKQQFSKESYIYLVKNECDGVLNVCPKQLGDSCGVFKGLPQGICDESWLKCEQKTCEDTNSTTICDTNDKQSQCVKKQLKSADSNGTGNQDLDSSKENSKRNPKQAYVPVCEHIKGEKTCKCSEEQDEKATKDLPTKFKWCFVHQIKDPNNPEKDCYDDVKFSKTAGRFYSYKAYQLTNKGKVQLLINVNKAIKC